MEAADLTAIIIIGTINRASGATYGLKRHRRVGAIGSIDDDEDNNPKEGRPRRALLAKRRAARNVGIQDGW